MKAGTSSFYDIISHHPQVISAIKRNNLIDIPWLYQVLLTLSGTVFKEPGCYYEENLRPSKVATRMHCYPFVESNEVSAPFMSVLPP